MMYAGRRLSRLIMALAIAAIITISIILICTNEAVASPEGDVYYTSVLIKGGDSLWDIASRYCDDDMDIKAYMDDIAGINGLSSNQSITAGSYLTVYYLK